MILPFDHILQPGISHYLAHKFSDGLLMLQFRSERALENLIGRSGKSTVAQELNSNMQLFFGLFIFLIPINMINYGWSATPSDTVVYLPGSNTNGIPYDQWAAKWWQWHVSIPESIHPRSHSSANNCPVGLVDGVSFITHNINEMSAPTCYLESDKPIMTTILSGECDSEEVATEDNAKILKCASEGQDGASLEVYLDGVVINDLDKHLVTSKFFNITYPEDNVYGVDAGTFKAIVNGYFLFLKPLPKGEHELLIKGSINNPADQTFNLAYQTKYKLVMK